MNAKQSLAIVEDMYASSREGDWDKVAALLASDVVLRIAGVPSATGGRIEGRDAVLDFLKTGQATSEPRHIFGDDVNVCSVGKFSAAAFPGSAYFKGADKPFTTWQCSVYRIANGEIAEVTNYINWADVYVQTGVIDVASLLA